MIKISGLVPAANYLQIPKSRNGNLGLTGRFLYVQVGDAHCPAEPKRHYAELPHSRWCVRNSFLSNQSTILANRLKACRCV